MSVTSGESHEQEIVVVSGLPRSGTSLMMRILQFAGYELLVDHLRSNDQFNPHGYFEFEPVKNLKSGDTAWLQEAQGKVVKIVSPLLQFLPSSYRYRVVFMQRDLGEVLASQAKMLAGRQKPSTPQQDQQMKMVFQDHLSRVSDWLNRQPNMQTLPLHYNLLVIEPELALSDLAHFLGRPLDTTQMRKAIDPQLYRNRQGLPQIIPGLS
ncbi:MAG TPA: sulfotransferase domain-containing protein [Anaerolineaceae bacterium]|nr:sulfotransferase domain-containing protein [Anaerolineaceae bacterium]